MPIQVACACGKSLSVPETFAGKTVRCRHCKTPLTVPCPTKAQEPTTFGLAPVSEPKEKIKPLLFDQQRKRERCQQCQMYVEDGEVLCDRCAGRTARKGAKIANQNSRPRKGADPGAEQAGQLKNIFLMPLYIIFFPFIALFNMCFPQDGGYRKKRRREEDEDDE